jgi:hypothetical protein
MVNASCQCEEHSDEAIAERPVFGRAGIATAVLPEPPRDDASSAASRRRFIACLAMTLNSRLATPV